MQRAIEKQACVIARKRSAAGVRAVKAWREADDDQSRLRITEGRDWCAVVVGVFLATCSEKARETRAIRAGAIENYAVGRPELQSHSRSLPSYARALWNCSSSVEPFIAVTDD
jgi:hypothetical protein